MTGRYPDAVDVAVVGSGPAGAAWARTLHENAPQLRVAVFEVGPVLSDPPGDHVKNIADPRARRRAQRASEGPAAEADADQPPASADGRRGRPGTFLLGDGFAAGGTGLPVGAMSSNVGGMGAHWTCACPRPGGTERVDFVEDLDELLDEAERLLGVSAQALADAPLAGQVRRLLGAALDADRPAGRRVQPMPLAVRREVDGTGAGRLHWSGPSVVLGDVLDHGVGLHPETLVERVLRDDGGAVRGIAVRDRRDGTAAEVAARVVVVAADALRTPQLLFASGVRPRALGRYLNDQPQVLLAVRLPDEVLAGDPVDEHAGTAIDGSSGVSWVPFDDDRHPFHGQVMQMDASPVPRPDLPADRPGAYVGLGWFCAKDVREQDRVEFDESATDDYGMPAPRVHYGLTAVDAERLAAAKAAITAAARALGRPIDDAPIELPAGSSLHYQGTTRMGRTDDGTSVCDVNGEVWGVPGLFVAGNGLIPTETACNPTLTTVALAVGGARHVAKNLAHRTEGGDGS
ncbi:GMC oxidoreductase [Kineococcus aurantiacus]|uniref:Pyranose oxidase n=1 Tax=Kineococcus aurantiacus TaxID=37633 RepID=A0A7Y9AUV2_9ACTN|nr:pyranose oxidase [Kineococcus aurantiacus]